MITPQGILATILVIWWAGSVVGMIAGDKIKIDIKPKRGFAVFNRTVWISFLVWLLWWGGFWS